MTAPLSLAGLLALPLVAAVALALRLRLQDRRQIDRVKATLAAAREAGPPRFGTEMVAGLPEVARRYLCHAIAEGTPLHRVVQLEMRGIFVLNGKRLPMRARQILAPPASGLVWQAGIGTGLMRFTGSDGYLAADPAAVLSWTRFWLAGLIPVARAGGNPDHARAASTRAMLEAIWAPAALLPQFGAHWAQTGPDSAEIRFDALKAIAPMQLTLDADGNPVEIQALRWTDANRDKVFRLQPFGGRLLEFGQFQGFTLPLRVELGNMYGAPGHEPFFLATITSARF